MTLKTLLTGAAAATVMAGAAVGVTSVAYPAIAAADECAVDGPTLQGVLDTLVAPGVPFNSPGKETLVQGGVGIVKGRLADGALKSAYADGTLPTTITVGPPTCTGNAATSTVSAAGKSMPITFVNEVGTWKVSSTSASTVLAAFSS